MDKEVLLPIVKIIGTILFYVITLRTFKFSKLATIFDIIVAFGSDLLLIGNQKPDYVLLGKCIVLAAFMFYLIRGLTSKLSTRLGAGIISVAQISYLLVPILNMAYYLQSGQGIGVDAMFAIAQTNFRETVEFLQARTMAVLGLIITYILLFAVFLRINRQIKKKLIYNISKKVKTVFAVLLIAIVWYGNTRIIRKSNIYASYQESQAFLHAADNHHVPDNLKAINRDNKLKNIVIVIGESANRDYYSLYGFKEKTTPWLDSMEQNRKIFKFNNAYSCDKFTTKVLALALAEPNQYNKLPRENSVDLVDVFHKAGYTVWWISNQGRNNNLHESSTFYASRADNTVFTSTNGVVHDEKLLEHLPKRLPDKGNVIFVHIMGSHGCYRERFPQAFEREFLSNVKRDANDVNAYCDSILYTDYVLQKIFEHCYKELNMDAFVYFSDHGEKPGVPRDRFFFQMTRIPLVIYTSPQYTKSHKKIVDNLKNNENKYFTNDLLYDTILGIADIATNHIEEQYDLTTSKYALTRDKALTEYGTIKVADDPFDK